MDTKNKIKNKLEELRKKLTQLYNQRDQVKNNLMIINQNIFRLEGMITAYQEMQHNSEEQLESEIKTIKE